MKRAVYLGLIFVLSCNCIVTSHAKTGTDTTLRIEGLPCTDLFEEQLIRLIPDNLKYYKASGLPNGITHFGAYIIPLRDSVGPRIDSQCIEYENVLVLYTNFANSMLTVYANNEGALENLWISPPVDGYGFIYLEDLNHDNHNEIIVRLNVGTHTYESVFILFLTDNQLGILNPSKKMGAFSEFLGHVDIKISDSGAVIKSCHPTEAISRTYFYRNNSAEIKLVSEKVINKKKR